MNTDCVSHAAYERLSIILINTKNPPEIDWTGVSTGEWGSKLHSHGVKS